MSGLQHVVSLKTNLPASPIISAFGRLDTLLLIPLGLYALGMSVFLIFENRRPQATLAWLLAFFFLPVLGGLIYIFFGRDWKAFSGRARLLKQDLEANALTLLSRLISDQDSEIERLQAQGTSHRKLTMLVRHNSRSILTSRNRVEIQQDAAVFYPSMVRDIEGARHSIHLQYYTGAAGAFTERLKEILSEKARAGIGVRLLHDPQGSHASLSRRYTKEMSDAGVRIAPTSRLYPLQTISYRNHRKITVIDGVIGYTGGMNMGQEHLDGGEGFDAWRDTQVRIAGDGATVLQAVFLVDWYNAVRENLFSPAYFPGAAEQAARVAPERGGCPNVPVQIITSGPDSQWAGIEQLYSLMVVSAQRHVFMQSPYFILTAAMAEALRTAALAGVEVKVMLSARP